MKLEQNDQKVSDESTRFERRLISITVALIILVVALSMID